MRFHEAKLVKTMQQIVGKENLKLNEPMAKHTTFRVGGPADFFVIPATRKALIMLLNLCLKRNLPYFILGRGSNLIVSDKGIRGVVISTSHLNQLIYRDDQVTVDCGYDLWKLSKNTARRGLSGLEFACGIPGSVGGAVFMNAGAYDSEISQVLVSSKVLEISPQSKTPCKIRVLTAQEHQFSYRHSVLQHESFIHLNSTFRLKQGNRESLLKEIDRLTRERESKQPLELPSAGSVFRRPEGFFVGKLIQDCNLKGLRIGGAAISEKHCGFIVNLGNATANDILTLIEHVRNTIQQRFGVLLQTEVRFVGKK